MDYKNGRIYKITSDSTNKIYIGSTCQSLSKRMTTHRSSYQSFLNGKHRTTTCAELIKLGDAIIILIEDYPCERREQLLARERYWIEFNKDKCINKCIPTRSKKEYRQDNREIIREYGKAYKEANRDKWKEYTKKYNKDYAETNKERLDEYYNAKINCICGCITNMKHKSRHEKTMKHQNFINSQVH